MYTNDVPDVPELSGDEIRMLCQQARYKSKKVREQMQKERSEFFTRLHENRKECQNLGLACADNDAIWGQHIVPVLRHK